MDRSLRLRDEWAINDVRRRGRAFSSGPLVARVLAIPDRSPTNQYAVIAGKRVGGAVERNRCKRLVREALRELHPRLRQGHAIAVIVRGGPNELTGKDVAVEHLTRIFTNARLLESRQPAETPPPDAAT
ncbi:MAG: ribonuclease P protein component [Thermomicrobiales bacterium]|nr:ribonuclease P protein component [Thermomicrobiales bacterium]